MWACPEFELQSFQFSANLLTKAGVKYKSVVSVLKFLPCAKSKHT